MPTSEQAVGFYWKLFHVVDDATIQCQMYIQLVKDLLCRKNLSILKSTIFSNKTAKIPALGVLRLVHKIQEKLPNNWVYVSNELRARVYLAMCQLFQERSGSGTENSGTIDAVETFAHPRDIFSCIDPDATWFR